MTTEFVFGQQVVFSRPLVRRAHRKQQGRPARTWVPNMYDDTRRTGIVVGIRTLADGEVEYNYDEPTVFYPTRHFRAYLIATDLRRKPVLVLPEDMR